MRAIVFVLALCLASTAQAQFPYNPIGHAQSQYARLQSGAAYPYYAPVYYGGYSAYESDVLYEMRMTRYAVEDAAFERRWARFNRYGR